jgi:glutathione synthase/RimK-type ligase-like ATP-grasp enzyme
MEVEAPEVILATCQTLPEPDPDAGIVEAALSRSGISHATLPWEGDLRTFQAATLTVIRSTWNYVHHRDAFLTFVDALHNRVENHPSVLRWNTHKRYLGALSDAGFAAVDTVLVPKGARVSLQTLIKKKHWFRAVVKPAVGAGSFLARVVGGSDEDERFFTEHLHTRDMLVQPYVPEVETTGERSLVFIDGEVTHAVKKAPRFGDAQESVTPVEMAEDEVALALRLMHWTMRNFPCGALLYGRADLVRVADGSLRVMELELAEPSLFLQYSETATERLVSGIKRRLALSPRRRFP